MASGRNMIWSISELATRAGLQGQSAGLQSTRWCCAGQQGAVKVTAVGSSHDLPLSCGVHPCVLRRRQDGVSSSGRCSTWPGCGCGGGGAAALCIALPPWGKRHSSIRMWQCCWHQVPTASLCAQLLCEPRWECTLACKAVRVFKRPTNRRRQLAPGRARRGLAAGLPLPPPPFPEQTDSQEPYHACMLND